MNFWAACLVFRRVLKEKREWERNSLVCILLLSCFSCFVFYSKHIQHFFAQIRLFKNTVKMHFIHFGLEITFYCKKKCLYLIFKKIFSIMSRLLPFTFTSAGDSFCEIWLFVFHGRKADKQVSEDTRLSKWWKVFHFSWTIALKIERING